MTVCQHYRLLALVFGQKRVEFEGGNIVICPTSLWTASLYIESDALFAPFSLPDTKGELRELQYRLTAWNEDACHTQDFRHKIEHKLTITSAAISRKVSPLFERDSLNLVLKTKAFPGVKCLQFVC